VPSKSGENAHRSSGRGLDRVHGAASASVREPLGARAAAQPAPLPRQPPPPGRGQGRLHRAAPEQQPERWEAGPRGDREY
jgi:hypothetical protein